MRQILNNLLNTSLTISDIKHIATIFDSKLPPYYKIRIIEANLGKDKTTDLALNDIIDSLKPY